jgi:hypothetical protein
LKAVSKPHTEKITPNMKRWIPNPALFLYYHTSKNLQYEKSINLENQCFIKNLSIKIMAQKLSQISEPRSKNGLYPKWNFCYDV